MDAMKRTIRALAIVIPMAHAVLLVSLGGTLSAQDVRLPIPPEERLAEARDLIDEMFSSELKKRDVSGRTKLAHELVRQGLKIKAGDAVQYCALVRAHELFLRAGNADGCMRAAAELGRLFEVDWLKMQLDAMVKIKSGLKSPDDRGVMAWRLLGVCERLARSRQFDLASKAVSYALALGKGAKNLPLVLSAREKKGWVAELRRLARGMSGLKGEERKSAERDYLSLLGTQPDALPKDGHVPNLGMMFHGETLAIAAGLMFSNFVVPVDREWTFTKGRVTLNNRSPVGRVSNEVKARIRLLCKDADRKHSVLEYWNDVRIVVKGPQDLDFSGLGNKHLKYYNENSFVPRNAHLAVFFDGKLIYQALWRRSGKSDTGRESKMPWWQDEGLLVKPK